MLFLILLLCALALGAMLAQPAQAYVDPGVGGMVYQVLIMIGAVFVTGFAVFRNKIKALFGRGKGDKAKDESDPEPKA